MYEPLISLIMPVYNGAAYLGEAIDSVRRQMYPHWELLIIDDGSTDDTRAQLTAAAVNCARVRPFYQDTNQGVSAARNVGLAQMRGEWFCFVDADDRLTPESLSIRLRTYGARQDVWFIDGIVLTYNESLTQLQGASCPAQWVCSPLRPLLRLHTGFFTCPSWLIRTKALGKGIRLSTDMSHAEDLHFYISLAAEGGLWAAVAVPILTYRKCAGSAMRNLAGLAQGYRLLYKKLRNTHNWAQPRWAWYCLWWRIKRIMFLSFLRRGECRAAFRFLQPL